MKKYFIPALICWCLLTLSSEIIAQDQGTLSFNLQAFEKVRIANYKGKVNINGSSGNELQIKFKRQNHNSSASDVNEKVFLDTTVIDGEFIVFVRFPDKYFKIDEDGHSYYNSEDWDNWDKSKIKQRRYDVEFSLDIQIPSSKVLYAATHWKDVKVTGIRNNTIAKSHHGEVEVDVEAQKLYVKSHHGDIRIKNSHPNMLEGYFKTHHGDITTSFSRVNATAAVDTYHGDLYTDFEYTIQPMLVNLETDKKKSKYKYKGQNAVKFGNGSGQLKYKTHHGDIFIKNLNNN